MSLNNSHMPPCQSRTLGPSQKNEISTPKLLIQEGKTCWGHTDLSVVFLLSSSHCDRHSAQGNHSSFAVRTTAVHSYLRTSV